MNKQPFFPKDLSRLLAGEYCQSCRSHRLSLTEDLMVSCKDCCEEHSFAPILLIEYLTVCRDLLKAKGRRGGDNEINVQTNS